jgi:hypothetical protein
LRFRKLRIAWSVGWGIACVLLIVLWVRSYWWADTLAYFHDCRTYGITAEQGNFLPYATEPGGCREDMFRWVSTSGLIDHPANSQPKAFHFSKDFDGSVLLCIPMWFTVAPLAVFAMAPWLRKSFSLRTLLIATTLVAVVLGLIVWLL